MEKKDIKIYIENNWLTGETCLFMYNDSLRKALLKSQLSTSRKKFVKGLEEEGYTIIYNTDEADEATIYLSMDPYALAPSELETAEYGKLVEKEIASKAGENFNFPKSLEIEEYFEKPFFPAVFKDEGANGGDDKFLIESEEQLEKIKEFYSKYKDVEPYKSTFEYIIFQQYLETPSDYQTYLRVLVGGNGEPLGASLKYSKGCVSKSDGVPIFEKVFLNPKSEYYIGAKKMFNYYSGGDNIYLPQVRYSYEKEEILRAHGFDPDDPQLPEEVLDVCSNIMHNCNPVIGVLCGIDFMLNKEDGKWYYLENQGFPAIDEWAKRKGVSLLGSHDTKGYMRYLDIELQARRDALDLALNEKLNSNSTEKVFKKA